ncbi:MAG: hypothetical protein Q4B26_11905, partial [Eubacteriales bacterium]|nr:hypothetical protein [Eubacteriales bacterium]
MSQKKVDYYKEQKANRAKIIKREKRILFFEKCAGVLVLLLAVCWIVFSVYGKVTANRVVENKQTVINTEALENYSSLLSSQNTDEANGEELEVVEDDAVEETEEAAEEPEENTEEDEETT